MGPWKDTYRSGNVQRDLSILGRIYLTKVESLLICRFSICKVVPTCGQEVPQWAPGRTHIDLGMCSVQPLERDDEDNSLQTGVGGGFSQFPGLNTSTATVQH